MSEDRKAKCREWSAYRFWACTAQVRKKGLFGRHDCQARATKEPDRNGNPTRCALHSTGSISGRRGGA